MSMQTLADNLSKEELSFLFRRKSVKDMARILGLTTSNTYALMRERKFQTGKEFLKTHQNDELAKEVACHVSFKAMAKYYACSAAFVKALVRDVYDPYPSEKVFHEPSHVQDVWNRTGSVALTGVLLDVTPSVLRAFIKQNKLVKPDAPDYNTDLSHQFGRQAERDYREFRNLPIEADRTYHDPNHPYDIDDQEYGKVNVKASKVARYKQKSLLDKEYWKFDLTGAPACNNFALMFYRKGKLIEIVMLPSSAASAMKTTTLIVNYKNREIIRLFGRIL